MTDEDLGRQACGDRICTYSSQAGHRAHACPRRPAGFRWVGRARAALARAIRCVRLELLRARLICALHGLRSVEAYGDRDGWAGYWLDRIDDLTREIRAVERAAIAKATGAQA